MENIPVNSFQHPVFMDMDGSSDDMVSLILLLTLSNYRLTGVSITNGNCYAGNAVESVLRIFGLFCRYDLELAVSNAEAVNPFPDAWRKKGQLINELNILKKIEPDFTKKSSKEASDFTAKKIKEQKEKSYIVLTGPATNLVNTIEKYPEIKDHIEKVYWMAGAFLSNGNVIAPDHDGSAEWNIFWDPASAKKLIQSGLKITFFPLDACYQVPIDNYLMYFLKKQSRFRLSKLVYNILEYSLEDHNKYYLWDVLPSLCLEFPEIAKISNTSIDIEQRGTSLGNIFKTSKGSPIHYASLIDDEKYYSTLIQKFSQF